jgi:broad specificity phosphatase PhoE
VRLVLVRHGITEGAEGTCMGHCDLPLATHGRPALARLAAAWRDDAAAGQAAVPAPTRLWTSDLARARASAEPFASAFGLAPTADARLREMHFGAWEGRAWSALEAEDGARLGRWMAGWATERAPDGEAFPDVAVRAAAWLADVRAAATRDDVVLAVAHAGSIRALLCTLMGWPLADAFRVRHDHARVTALRVPVDGRAPELLVLNADRVPGA